MRSTTPTSGCLMLRCPWSVPQIAPAVPERPSAGNGERCCVDPVIDSCIGPVGVSDTVRSLERAMRPIGGGVHSELHRRARVSLQEGIDLPPADHSAGETMVQQGFAGTYR